MSQSIHPIRLIIDIYNPIQKKEYLYHD